MSSVTMINAVVSKALFDTQIQTLDAFLVFLPEKYGDDVDMDFMKEAVEAFKEKLQNEYKPPRGVSKVLKELDDFNTSDDATTSTGVKQSTKKSSKSTKKSSNNDDDSNDDKKKRAPSAYTMFIKHKMALLKKENDGDMKGVNCMKLAAAAWKELTEDQQNEMKTNFKQLSEEYSGDEDDADKQTKLAKMMYESVFPEDNN